jgi:hypothetical protein
LFLHCVRRAASRAACTAGNSNAINNAMIPIATNSSISVNPREADCFAVDDSISVTSSFLKHRSVGAKHVEQQDESANATVMMRSILSSALL